MLVTEDKPVSTREEQCHQSSYPQTGERQSFKVSLSLSEREFFLLVCSLLLIVFILR